MFDNIPYLDTIEQKLDFVYNTYPADGVVSKSRTRPRFIGRLVTLHINPHCIVCSLTPVSGSYHSQRVTFCLISHVIIRYWSRLTTR